MVHFILVFAPLAWASLTKLYLRLCIPPHQILKIANFFVFTEIYTIQLYVLYSIKEIKPAFSRINRRHPYMVIEAVEFVIRIFVAPSR